PGLTPGGLHTADTRLPVGDAPRRMDEARAEPGRQLPCARAHRGDVEGNRIRDVDRADLRVEEADLASLALERPLDRLSRQETDDDADVLLEVGQLHRAQAHRPARGEARRDSEVDPSWRQCVQARKA